MSLLAFREETRYASSGRSRSTCCNVCNATRAVQEALRDYNGSSEPLVPGSSTALAAALGLQLFLWFDFTLGNQERILLAAGVAQGVSASHAALSSDDLADFTMLGRHLAVLLSNATLIGALETTRAQLQNLFDHMRQAILTFDASAQVGRSCHVKPSRYFHASS